MAKMRTYFDMTSAPMYMKDRVDELKGKVMRRSHEEVPASPAAAPAAADDFAARLKPDWGTRKRIATLVELLSEEDINELIDKVTRMNGAQRIIKRYHPQATWLWRQWHGTVLEQTYQHGVDRAALHHHLEFRNFMEIKSSNLKFRRYCFH